MIFKKIKANPAKIKSRAAHIRDLTSYITDPTRTVEAEKVLYTNSRNFLCEDLESQQHEMIALAADAARSKNPIAHYLLSWREGEQPNASQIEEAVTVLLDELGLAEHQVIYALHVDTHNYHVHVAVNRVHPDTGKVIKPNKGFDIEAGHKAIAKIEQLQGWQSEKNARYKATENELAKSQEAASKRQPEQRKRDREGRSGEKSAERVAIENAPAIIKSATTWQQLHEQLAAAGMRYERKGSGALIFVGDVPVKASAADRGASLTALEKRLGAFVPAAPDITVAARAPEPVKETPGWSDYKSARDAHYTAKHEGVAKLRERHDAQRKALSEKQKERRQEFYAGRWKGKGDLLNALRSVLAAEQAAEKAALKEAQQIEREALRATAPPFPDFEGWLRNRDQHNIAEAYRYRVTPDAQPIKISPARHEDIRDFRANIDGGLVRYANRQTGQIAFVDAGKHIDVSPGRRDPAAILAALQLARQKFPSGLTLTGDDQEFKRIACQLAAKHGIKILNPELQPLITQEKQRVQRAHQSPARRIPPAPLRNRMHTLSERALVQDEEAGSQVLLPQDVPRSLASRDATGRDDRGLRRAGDGRGNAAGDRNASTRAVRTDPADRSTTQHPAGQHRDSAAAAAHPDPIRRSNSGTERAAELGLGSARGRTSRTGQQPHADGVAFPQSAQATAQSAESRETAPTHDVPPVASMLAQPSDFDGVAALREQYPDAIVAVPGQHYSGKVRAVNQTHIVHSTGMGAPVIHRRQDLPHDYSPEDILNVRYPTSAGKAIDLARTRDGGRDDL